MLPQPESQSAQTRQPCPVSGGHCIAAEYNGISSRGLHYVNPYFMLCCCLAFFSCL